MSELTYQDFLNRDMTLEPFGILRGESESTYFCTPRGATILGWTGVDGIHYVQIKELGEMVFAVNPYAAPGRHAHPVAKSFTDFLCLLLKCGHESHLEQAHAWSWEQYEEFCQQNPMTAAQNEASERMIKQLDLKPISDAYGYLTQLDATFDFGCIPYGDEYWEYVPREMVPEESVWRVYYSASFCERGKSGEKAGEELPLDVRFAWDDRQWRVLAMYRCAKGVVIDMVATATLQQMSAYMEKWGRRGDLSPSEEWAAQAESPLRDDVRPVAIINGKMSSMERMGCMAVTGEQEDLSPSVQQILTHYGLDEHTPMLLCRVAFPWGTAKKPVLRSLQLSMSRRPSMRAGEPFSVCGAGECVSICHPVSGEVHRLTVQTYEHRSMPQHAGAGLCIPTCGVQMTYTLTPDLPGEECTLQDVRRSDAPIKAERSMRAADDFCSVAVANVPVRVESEAAAIGIIGGADGPTAMVVGRAPGQSAVHAACSAWTFEPQEQVVWQPIFRVKACEDVVVQIV